MKRRWTAALLVTLALLPLAGVPGVGVPRSPEPSPEVVAASEDLYPSFPLAPELLVVRASPGSVPAGEYLALVTLQGIVNRGSVRLYVDSGDQWGNSSALLAFLKAHYGIRTRTIGVDDFFRTFAGEAKGVVVYDPHRPATVNLATTYAGVYDLVAADPSFAASLYEQYGLGVGLDLRQQPWAGLRDDEAVVRFSLDRLYPEVDHHRLITLRPDRYGLRDYAVATRAFVFYLPQGPYVSPGSVGLTEEVLARFPQGIPVLGWFETPTHAEENFFVLRSSRYGKVILGGQDLLDLTVLTSVGRGSRDDLASRPSGMALGDKIYVAFAVPDGDNLDFLTGQVTPLWNDPARGRIPLAWSMDPVLQDLAPPILHYYTSTRTANDSFVAGPSGAGYLYPGFASRTALAVHLERTRLAMEATGMREAWLLNSFTAYEPPYPDEVLQAYVATLGPRGIMLDYGDIATTRDYWMAAGGDHAAPIIRTTHLWGSVANFEGKVSVEVDALGRGPHFIFAAVYPWTFGPSDAVAALEGLRARYGDRVVAVSTADLFDLMERHFVERARAVGRSGMSLPWEAGGTRAYVDLAEAEAASGDYPRAGYYGYAALEAQEASTAAFYLLVLVVIVAAFVAVLWAFPRGPRRRIGVPWATASFAFAALGFLLGTREVLKGNFWDYYPLGFGVVAAGLALVATTGIGAAGSRWVGGGLEAGSLLFLPLTPLAFVPLAAGTVLLLAGPLRADPRLAPDLILGAHVGLLVSLAPLPYNAALAVPLVALATFLPGGRSMFLHMVPPLWGRRGATLTAIAVASAVPVSLLPLDGLHFLFLRLGPLAGDGSGLDLVAPGLALAVALALLRAQGSQGTRRVALTALGIPAASLALFLSPGPFPAALAVVALLGLLLYFPLVLSLRLPADGRPGPVALALRWPAFAALAALLGTLPGVTYSLLLPPLPLAIQYVLYATPLLLALVGFGLAGLTLSALGHPWRLGHGGRGQDPGA